LAHLRPPASNVNLIVPTILPSITVDSLDVQLIKSSLRTNTAQVNLIDKLTSISEVSTKAQLSSIDIYTDGSLNKALATTNGSTIMGSGWFIPHLDISYGCASTHWPSSTKAELIAIWTAVLAIPMHINDVNIFTDSQAAIDGISKAKSSSWNMRQYQVTKLNDH